MKLSVSVPDGLWLTAVIVSGSDSPSAIVQTALKEYVKGKKISTKDKLRIFDELVDYDFEDD